MENEELMEKIKELTKELARVAAERGMSVEVYLKPIVSDCTTTFGKLRTFPEILESCSHTTDEFKFSE